MSAESRPRYGFFVVLVVILTPLYAFAVWWAWLRNPVGAFGVGVTLAYVTSMLLYMYGAGPVEREIPEPALRTPDVWVYLQCFTDRIYLTFMPTSPEPVTLGGVDRDQVMGLEVDVLRGGEVLRRKPLFREVAKPVSHALPPSDFSFVRADFDPGRARGLEVEVDMKPALAGLEPGRYDLRFRWDPRAFAPAGTWTVPEPVVLGIAPVTLR